MARADLAAQPLPRTGKALDAAAVAASVDGNSFDHTPRRMLLLQNSGAAPATATVQIPAMVEGQDIVDLPVTVPANDFLLLPPFSAVYRQTNGKVYIDYADATNLSVAVLELPA